MSTTALAVVGTTALTGGGILSWFVRKPIEPRYRILDKVKKDGHWIYKGHLVLQKRAFGRWWKVKKITIKSHNRMTYDGNIEELKNTIRYKLSSDEVRNPKAIFDTKFDELLPIGD